MFNWTKTSTKGSSHPVNARISIGMNEIVTLAALSKEQKQNIKILLNEVSKDILAAEDRALIVIKEIDEIECRKAHLNNPNVFESVQNLKSAVDFLTHAKSALRNTCRVVGLLFKVENYPARWGNYKNAKFNEIKKDLINKENLPVDALIIYILNVYENWYTLLTRINDEVRHPNLIDSVLVNYEFNSKPYFKAGGCFKGKNVPVHEFLKDSLEYLLPFCEMFILSALLEFLPEEIAIIGIPIDQRNPNCPKRFRISLVAHEDYVWHQNLYKAILVLRQLVALNSSIPNVENTV